MVGMLSDVGKVRSNNQDYIDYFEDDDRRLYIISDGMGGYKGGEIASSLAVKTLMDFVKNSDLLDEIKVLKEGINIANKVVFNKSKENAELKGMGCTITSCLVVGKKMVVANVGDSSCYILKNGEMSKITKDHTYVQQLIDKGIITEEQAKTHPNKNVITRAIGTFENVDIDVFSLDLQSIEKVLMCTDGLTNELSLNEIKEILGRFSVEETCKRLVELAKVRGGRDNISVIVFEGECGV